MQVVILCGGLGTRLKEITKAVPKSMVLIHGKPFLQYLVELLVQQGYFQFLFLTGYLGEQIQSYFLNGDSWGVRIQYSQELSPIGTGGALQIAEKYIEDDFLLLYGDSYLDIFYKNFFEEFQKNKKIAQVAVFKDLNQETRVIPNILWDAKSKQIVSYQKDAGGSHTHIDAGVLALSKSVFQFFPSGLNSFSLENNIFPLLLQKNELMGYEVPHRFYDIGTFERLKVFEQAAQ